MLNVQWSTNLGSADPGGWVDVPVGTASTGPDPNGIIITVTERGGAPDNVVVAIPRGLQIMGRLFVRLKATMP